jgi:Lrp/AsnC family leucine-responsive transcriptional regulator
MPKRNGNLKVKSGFDLGSTRNHEVLLMNPKIDQYDQKILQLLQEDARMSHAELGRQVHLSQPAVSERIKRLEASNIIRGYRADINPKALGYEITAMIRVSTQQGRPYAQYVANCPEIIDCYTVTGEDGAVMRVLASDVEHLQRIINELNTFGSTSTAIVLTTHVSGKAIAVPSIVHDKY